MLKKYLLIIGIALLFVACKKEDTLSPSDKFGLIELFEPGSDTPQVVKDLFSQYGVWVRMDWTNDDIVKNAYLGQDLYNSYPVLKVDADKQASAYTYITTFLNQAPAAFVRKNFPLDIFIVKTYGNPEYPMSIMLLGRSRLLFDWPNSTYNALAIVKEPQYHFYQDTILAQELWDKMATVIAQKIEPIKDFITVGTPYDNGTALRKIYDDYYIDYDYEKMQQRLEELANAGGFIDGSGSRSFKTDIAQWITQIAISSYQEIYDKYLKNSLKHQLKYKAVIDYFNTQGWDIQATGNNFSQIKKDHPYPAN